MAPRLAQLGLAIVVGGGGCSLIYNPDNLKVVSDAKIYEDAPPPDTEIIVDANPSAVAFDPMTPIFPTAVDEGAGVYNSRPAIIALHGEQFIPTATVSFMPSTAVTLVEQKVSSDHAYIVLAVQVPIDMSCAPPTTIPVRVQVDQPDGTGGTATTHLDSAFAVTCLNELTMVKASSALDAKYSTIEITGAYAFSSAGSETPPAVLRSVSHITISGAVTASASVQDSGPGGGRGGDAAASGSGPGAGVGGASGLGGSGGGGAGFSALGVMGTGSGNTGGKGAGGPIACDQYISTYTNCRSSGGGGGGNATAGTGGAGGGGAGTVEITAGGDVSISDVTAVGGNSAPGTGVGGADGGAGAGGLVLVRSGGTLGLGTVTVMPGSPPSGGNGGASSPGRIRVDSAKGAQAPAGGYVGPMFIDAPLTVAAYPTLMMRGTTNEHSSLLEVLDRDGNIVDNGHLYNPAFGPSGTGTVQPTLKVGYNHICVMVTNNNNPNATEATNCIDIGYAP